MTTYEIHPTLESVVCTPDGGVIECRHEAAAKRVRDELNARGHEITRLRTALRFYARGEHFQAEDGAFDSVSGEPENWLRSTRDDDTTMIENGKVACSALRAIDVTWIDGDDFTPQPIDGEAA